MRNVAFARAMSILHMSYTFEHIHLANSMPSSCGYNAQTGHQGPQMAVKPIWFELMTLHSFAGQSCADVVSFSWFCFF